MDIKFWQQRWKEKQTGFHRDSVNPYLVTHWDSLAVDSNSVVFVPLCGKSLDVIWLANQGHDVIGVECSHLAIEEFLDGNKLSYQQGKYNDFDVYTSSNIHLICGDYFSLSSELMEEVAAVFDRASLVALPAEKRKRYVDKQVEILPENVKLLLVALEYNQQLMNGPPFSVSQHEVLDLYQDKFKVNELSRNNILDDEPRFKQRGIDYLTETVYLLERKF